MVSLRHGINLLRSQESFRDKAQDEFFFLNFAQYVDGFTHLSVIELF